MGSGDEDGGFLEVPMGFLEVPRGSQRRLECRAGKANLKRT